MSNKFQFPILPDMSLSGLQKDVLHLYRALLKTARKKVGGVPKSDLEKLGEQYRPFVRSLPLHHLKIPVSHSHPKVSRGCEKLASQ